MHYSRGIKQNVNEIISKQCIHCSDCLISMRLLWNETLGLGEQHGKFIAIRK